MPVKSYSLRETASILGVKVRTVREWVKLGKIAALKGGNGWYWEIPESEIEKRLKEDDKCSKHSG